ncbi:MAG: PLP-dependent aminotransferase family protein [Ekhidna sp.]
MWNRKFDKSDRKKFLHLVEYIIELIDSGELAPGQALPTQRELSRRLGVSIGTITKAFNELEKMGYLSGEIGRGTFVKDISSDFSQFWFTESKVPYEYNLGHYRTTELFNHSIQLNLLGSIREVANDSLLFGHLHDLNNLGSGDLKMAFAGWIRSLGFSALSENEITVLSSDIFSVNVLVNAFTQPGDTILMEEIGDRISRDQTEKAGRVVETVKMDEKGIDPNDLKAAIKKCQPKILLTNPTFHNPTSNTTALKRKQEISEVCAAHGVLIVEDGKVDMFHEGEVYPYYTINPDNAIYNTGLYFHINPSLTTSVVVAKPDVLKQVEEVYTLNYWNGSQLLHQIALNLIESGRAGTIITEKKKMLKERNLLVNEIMGVHSESSTSVLRWLAIPYGKSSAELTQMAYENGILVRNSDIFSLNKAQASPPYIRICNGATHETDQFTSALKLLKELFENQSAEVKVR